MTRDLDTRQFWIRSPGSGEIVEATVAPPGEGEVCVETSFSGISRGTEALVFRGEVPASQYQDMRAPFQEGSFPGPVKYGYSSVGRVVHASGPDAPLVGRAVFCLHPHQDRYVVPASAVVPLPSGVPESRAVLAANTETAVNVVWDAGPSIGDRVVVVGGGVVGLLVAWLVSRIPGTEVLVVDINPARAGVAAALGLRCSTGLEEPAGADLVVHASGSPEGAVTALAAAGPEARVVEASWYGTRSVPLPLGEGFHARRLTLRSSQVGRIPPDRLPRWTFGRRMRTALGLLEDPALDVLVSGESPFDDLPEVMRRLSAAGGDALCHRIRYDGGAPDAT